EHAGKRSTCPVCKQPLRIPDKTTPLPESTQLPLPVPEAGESEPPGSGKKVLNPKLVVIIAGLGLLLVALLILVVLVSGSHSPSEALKATFMYANEGRYSDANNGLSSEIRAAQEH